MLLYFRDCQSELSIGCTGQFLEVGMQRQVYGVERNLQSSVIGLVDWVRPPLSDITVETLEWCDELTQKSQR